VKKNLINLLRGRLPSRSKTDPFELRNFDCLVWYRCASMTKRLRKIHFFIFWLILKRQGFFTKAKIKRILRPRPRLDPEWIKDIEPVVLSLSDKADINQDLRDRLRSVYDCGYKRLLDRYQKEKIAKNMLVNMAKRITVFYQIKSEILDYIAKKKVMDLRTLKRNKKKLARMRPDVLCWILEDLQKQGRIEIYKAGKTFLQSR